MKVKSSCAFHPVFRSSNPLLIAMVLYCICVVNYYNYHPGQAKVSLNAVETEQRDLELKINQIQIMIGMSHIGSLIRVS